jgi:hypothetical protein
MPFGGFGVLGFYAAWLYIYNKIPQPVIREQYLIRLQILRRLIHQAGVHRRVLDLIETLIKRLFK